MKRGFKIIKDWEDELIWCPSQCYLSIEYKGLQYIIYLRWRHNDPWTATLVECRNDGLFHMHSGGVTYNDDGHKIADWVGLNINYYRDCELEKLKNHVVRVVNNCLIT